MVTTNKFGYMVFKSLLRSFGIMRRSRVEYPWSILEHVFFMWKVFE